MAHEDQANQEHLHVNLTWLEAYDATPSHDTIYASARGGDKDKHRIIDARLVPVEWSVGQGDSAQAIVRSIIHLLTGVGAFLLRPCAELEDKYRRRLTPSDKRLHRARQVGDPENWRTGLVVLWSKPDGRQWAASKD